VRLAMPLRFWVKVDFHGPMLSPYLGPCWDWTLRTSDAGYGNIKLDGYPVSTHRLAYELVRGPIPEGLHVNHLCRRPRCVNPAHLEAVTSVENWRRGSSPSAIAARRGCCARGHPYTKANTYITPRGYRQCRICQRSTVYSYRERQAA
jgi:hypothetical protein